MAARPTDGREQRVCVAQIGAAHGLKGEVRLWSFTQEPEAIARYGALESKDGTRRFTIEALRPAKDHFIATLDGIKDRDAAEALRNVELYVARGRLPATGHDEFYHADLIGLAAVSARGEPLGNIVAVHNFGAGDILEIRPTGRAATAMLPFNDAMVPKVDMAANRIVIDPPADWLDERQRSDAKP